MADIMFVSNISGNREVQDKVLTDLTCKNYGKSRVLIHFYAGLVVLSTYIAATTYR